MAAAVEKKKKKNPGENLSGASPRPRDGKLKWKCDETISMVLIKFVPSCVQVVNTAPRTEIKKKTKRWWRELCVWMFAWKEEWNRQSAIALFKP